MSEGHEIREIRTAFVTGATGLPGEDCPATTWFAGTRPTPRWKRNPGSTHPSFRTRVSP
jgi:hypothetical protein